MALTDKFEDLGPNSGLVEEMYRQFLENPGSVSASWRDFFADYAPRGAGPATGPRPDRQRPRPPPPAPRRARRLRPPRQRRAAGADGEAGGRCAAGHGRRDRRSRCAAPRRGSSRTWRPASRSRPPRRCGRSPAKLLEVNRQILNNHLNRVGRGKVSFTHLIAFAIAQGGRRRCRR